MTKSFYFFSKIEKENRKGRQKICRVGQVSGNTIVLFRPLWLLLYSFVMTLSISPNCENIPFLLKFY